LKKNWIRKIAHASFAILFFVIIVILYLVNNQTVIDLVYMLAAYTYGPLLGFFFFGLLTKYGVKDRLMPYVALGSPMLCYLLDHFSKSLFGFGFGFSILIMNGLITFLLMFILREKRK
jgi:Na+/proline symporter